MEKLNFRGNKSGNEKAFVNWSVIISGYIFKSMLEIYQHLTVNSALYGGGKLPVKQANALKATVVLLAILMVLTLGASTIFAITKLDNSPSVNVLPAKLDWTKTYGGAADDRAFYALPVKNGFLVVGSSRSILSDTTVGLALKLDNDGNQVWNKTYLEGFGTELRCAVNLNDGYLLVGNVFSEAGDVNGYITKTDNLGNILWSTTVGGTGVYKLFSGVATPDGFVVCGLTYSYGNNTSHSWMVKLSADGKVLWNRTFNESGDSALRSAVLTPDGCCIAVGYKDQKGDGNYDFYLLKILPNGILAWNKTYGGEESDKAYSITKAYDGYVLVGDIASTRTSTDAWVVKVDLKGNLVWNKTVGGKEADSPSYITGTKDGGYLVVGFTFSFGSGNRDFWLFKINEQGQVQFSCTQGDKSFQEAYSAFEYGDNSYIVVGWTDPIGRSDLIGKATYDFSIVKLSPQQNNKELLCVQVIVYVLTTIDILLIVFTLSKIRKIKKIKQENISGLILL
jgi:hypothetical protein